MKVHVLGSGSRGNAIVLESGDDRVLIDAGFGPRTLAGRMSEVGVDPGTIGALVLTHEHLDHVWGALRAALRWSWPVCASAGTLAGLPRTRAMTHVLDPRRELTVGDLALKIIRVPHDANEPIALVATSRTTGARVGVLYDLGHVTSRLASQFADLDVFLLESNHDDAMLQNGTYPLVVQRRIAGPQGHLSNADAGAVARACVHRGMRHLVLCHLSQNNNRPDVALRSMKSALRGTGFRGTLHAAPQSTTMSLSLGRALHEGQLSLAL